MTKIGATRNGLLDGPLYKRMQGLVFDTAYGAVMDTGLALPAQLRMHETSPAQSSENIFARTSRWKDECGQSRTRVTNHA